MNRSTTGRRLAALGIGLAVAIGVGAQPLFAQTGPRTLPANPNPQLQDGFDRQQDQFERRDEGQYRGQSDRGPYDQRGNQERRLEERLAFLHSQLRITPAQERAWLRLADVVRDEAGNRERPEDRRYIRAPSVLDRLEERQAMLAERSQRLDRLMLALRPLYASFSAEQKRTADRLLFQPDRERFDPRGDRRNGDGYRGEPRNDREGRFDPRDGDGSRDYR